jgi:hypothetical protein
MDLAEARGGRTHKVPIESISSTFSSPLCHHLDPVSRLCVTCMSPGWGRGIGRDSRLSPAEGLELLRRIEAMDALIRALRRGREGGWGKYFVNVAAALVSQMAKPLGVSRR